MYPIIMDFFIKGSFCLLLFLPFYGLLYFFAPEMFLEEAVEENDYDTWQGLHKPRPGIPAIIAELYSVAKLLLFDFTWLKGEGEWGLNLGVFLYLPVMTIILLVVEVLFYSYRQWWSFISLFIFLPIISFIEVIDGRFSFKDVPLDYTDTPDGEPIYAEEAVGEEKPSNDPDNSYDPNEPIDPNDPPTPKDPSDTTPEDTNEPPSPEDSTDPKSPDDSNEPPTPTDESPSSDPNEPPEKKLYRL
uniref:Uncharacterized protein n=1 Tax=Strombidium inclinatum TaxID=197538 RepID=A0A7S3IFS0_9SPIT|mmetsp:Transcript_14655/g.22713  ORF Transcript_14655/g.22713 Transcript_14655/m.22713 type:complete len:244 (+) Transcript_14655:398-1129(+)